MMLCQIWHIPDGFATLLLAVATLLAGSFVIFGAIVAWQSAQRQIRSAEVIEQKRRDNEIAIIENGFKAELLAYSRAIIEASSNWNQRASKSPQQTGITNLPIFQDPLFYRANIGRIGLLRQPWVAGALIGFYANLLELNDQSKETLAGRPTVNTTNERIAGRLHLMAANISPALDGLNDDKKFPLPPDIHLDSLFMPDGKFVSQADNVPRNLQEVLLRLAGRDRRAP